MVEVESESCIFCEIVARRSPARVLLENDDCISFLDIAPASTGHALIIPKVHYRDIYDIDLDVLSATVKMTKEVADLLEVTLKSEGSTVFQMNREVGWQTVFHFHFHVIPRWRRDGLIEPWVEKIAASAELDATHKRILKSSSQTYSAMAKLDVAPGEGAFRTADTFPNR